MLTDIISQVESIVLPLMVDAGLELVDLIIIERNSTYMIEILTDRPQGGINLEECAAINKRIVEVLDSTQPWADDYQLTVASPGLDRHLKNQKDFKTDVRPTREISFDRKIRRQRRIFRFDKGGS
jgi:ribosome maturation factor RimP